MKVCSILRKTVVILIILAVVSYYIPIISSIVLAADATDYDFTNELNADRVGIGFTWTAGTRTLTITGIKNENAMLKLPEDSTIDIQGSIENTIKGIDASGNLTIRGNDTAILNMSKCETVVGNANYASILSKGNLIVESGNINIKATVDSRLSNVMYHGIYATNIIINNGKVNIDISGTSGFSNTFHAVRIINKMVINDGNISLKSEHDAIYSNSTLKDVKAQINGGEIKIISNSGYGVLGQAEINGGNTDVSAFNDSKCGAFDRVPFVNPVVNWEILYQERENNVLVLKAAEIIDIYNIYASIRVKLCAKDTEGTPKNKHNATDYDFTDELNIDRVGIGFTWTAGTRTLTITGIKNENAMLKFPDNSIIDIQGSIENTIKGIDASGNLTIRGNDTAILNMSKCETIVGNANYASILSKGDLIVESGNINIKATVDSRLSNVMYHGIYATNIIINNGKVNIDISGTSGFSNTFHAVRIINKMVINDGNISLKSEHDTIYSNSTLKDIKAQINGGEIKIISNSGYGVLGQAEINGGNTDVSAFNYSKYGAFDRVPFVNPVVNWKILYQERENNTFVQKEAEIIDIYNIYANRRVKLLSDVPATGMTKITGENEIGIGEKATFIATLEPSYATSEVIWSSSDENIAIVSEEGEITGVSLGTATITATANGFSASKDIDVKCKITLDPNGVEGIKKNSVYTDINGKLEELPTLSDNANIFNKWVDENGKEVTTNTVFSTNATIYADWTAKPILVGEQKNIAKYGETTIVNYDVTADFGGTYTVKVENLPEGVTLINDNISLDASENGKYIGTIKLSVSNMVNAGQITNLKMYVNNKNTSNNFSLEINKAESTINTKPQVKNIVYTGIEEALIEKGTTSTGTMKYSVNGKTFTNDIPKAANAGKYTIYYKVIGDNNHNDSEIFTIEATINKADSTIEKIPVGKNLSYTGTEQELIQAGTTQTGTIEYSVNGKTFTTNIPKGLNTGEYTIYYKVIGDNNHNDSEVFTLKATINKVNSLVEVQPIGKTLKYTGKEQELIEPGTTSTGIIEYSVDGKTFTTNTPRGLNAGEYTIYYRVVGDDNHSDSEVATIVATISKIASTIDTKPQAKVLSYTGTEQELVQAGTTSTGTMEYSIDGKTFTTNIPKGLNAGNYTVYYKVIGDNNHNNTEISSVIVTIAKVQSSFIQEPSHKVVVFNGEEQEIIKAGSTNDGIILYSLDGVNFSDKIPTAMNVGKYKVYYRIVGDKNHLDSEIKSVESIITDLIGDINGDGKVNARDAKLVLHAFNGSVELTEEQKVKADVNGDGKINARDAKLILQIFNGK